MPLPNQLKLLNSVRDFLAEGKLVFPFLAWGPNRPFRTSARPGKNCPAAPPSRKVFPAICWNVLSISLPSPDTNVHSLLILRNGAVVCEGHFAPYSGDYWHVYLISANLLLELLSGWP